MGVGDLTVDVVELDDVVETASTGVSVKLSLWAEMDVVTPSLGVGVVTTGSSSCSGSFL